MQAIFGFLLLCVLTIGGCGYTIGTSAGVRQVQQEAVNKRYGYYSVGTNGIPTFNWVK